ncbi:hypothetical protein QUB53_28575 [Microcoleus sp. AT8-B4]|uniref:hypothetical protein n=1 Tax=Microcoleus sp. AT8-B4 TaxID=2818620 RepID=UPI002FD60E82
MSKTDQPSQWASTTVAVAELGISRNHLLKLKEDCTFKPGEHWRNIQRTNAARPSYRWHLPSIHKILSIGPELRKHFSTRYPARRN